MSEMKSVRKCRVLVDVNTFDAVLKPSCRCVAQGHCRLMTRGWGRSFRIVITMSSLAVMMHRMSAVILCLSFCIAVALGVHLASVAVAIRACRPRPQGNKVSADTPPISIVLPVCGIENYIEDTLRSAFRLDYPRYELIFCAV